MTCRDACDRSPVAVQPSPSVPDNASAHRRPSVPRTPAPTPPAAAPPTPPTPRLPATASAQTPSTAPPRRRTADRSRGRRASSPTRSQPPSFSPRSAASHRRHRGPRRRPPARRRRDPCSRPRAKRPRRPHLRCCPAGEPPARLARSRAAPRLHGGVLRLPASQPHGRSVAARRRHRGVANRDFDRCASACGWALDEARGRTRWTPPESTVAERSGELLGPP